MHVTVSCTYVYFLKSHRSFFIYKRLYTITGLSCHGQRHLCENSYLRIMVTAAVMGENII